jgi:hypothetical protein
MKMLKWKILKRKILKEVGDLLPENLLRRALLKTSDHFFYQEPMMQQIFIINFS